MKEVAFAIMDSENSLRRCAWWVEQEWSHSLMDVASAAESTQREFDFLTTTRSRSVQEALLDLFRR